ncbi:MAG: hypothetical protein ACOH5I_12295 [Oligoflexus sp.]
MKLASIACGLSFLVSPLFVGQLQADEKTVVLGTEQTYSVAAMKERCGLFKDNQQLKTFNVKVECEKTENVWNQTTQVKPLPRWTEYRAAGMGKGKILDETQTEELESEGLECLVYEEKTVLYKGYLELSCEEFIDQVHDLVSLCKDGFIQSKGEHIMPNWQQVGDLETGNLVSDGCNTDVVEIQPSKPGQSQEQQASQQQQQR